MKIKYFLLAAVLIFATAAFSQEIQIKDKAPFTYAYLECSGSWQQIPVKIGEFIGEFFKQGLTPAGELFGMYFNSLDEVSEADLKWYVGFAIPDKSEVKEPLKKGEYKFSKIAHYVYTGPYDKVGDTYMMIFKQIAEKGYVPAGPVMENYLNDPSNTKPEELRTEIIIPVAKK